MSDSLLNYYIDLFCQIKRGNYRGRIYNAKPIFLLFIIEKIEEKVIKNNRVYFLEFVTDKSYVHFAEQYTNRPTPIQYPFYHLQNDLHI